MCKQKGSRVHTQAHSKQAQRQAWSGQSWREILQQLFEGSEKTRAPNQQPAEHHAPTHYFARPSDVASLCDASQKLSCQLVAMFSHLLLI